MYSTSAGLFPITSNTTGISYSINWSRLLFDNLPKRRRKSIFFTYVQSIFSQIKISYDRFLEFRNDTLFTANINSNTIVFEKYLRLFYNNDNINIINSSFVFQNTFLYRKAEVGNALQNRYLYKKGETNANQIYLFNKAESVLNYDFKIQIPIAIINSGVTIAEIEAIVDNYKMLGTIYTIEIVN